MDAIKVATLGDSDQAQVGESSVVIGNADCTLQRLSGAIKQLLKTI